MKAMSGFFTKDHSQTEIMCLVVETISRLMEEGKNFSIEIEVENGKERPANFVPVQGVS